MYIFINTSKKQSFLRFYFCISLRFSDKVLFRQVSVTWRIKEYFIEPFDSYLSGIAVVRFMFNWRWVISFESPVGRNIVSAQELWLHLHSQSFSEHFLTLLFSLQCFFASNNLVLLAVNQLAAKLCIADVNRYLSNLGRFASVSIFPLMFIRQGYADRKDTHQIIY